MLAFKLSGCLGTKNQRPPPWLCEQSDHIHCVDSHSSARKAVGRSTAQGYAKLREKKELNALYRSPAAPRDVLQGEEAEAHRVALNCLKNCTTLSLRWQEDDRLRCVAKLVLLC